MSGSNRLYIGEVVFLEETSSTNQVLVDALRAGATDGLVVVADRQSAGRGRLPTELGQSASRFSALFDPVAPGVACRPALQPHERRGARRAPRVRGLCGTDVSLKWPNDLVTPPGSSPAYLPSWSSRRRHRRSSSDRMQSLLARGVAAGDDSTGIAELTKDATTLEQSCGRQIPRDEFLDSFLDEVDSLYSTLLGPDGPGTIRREYASSCSTIGQRVQVDTPTGRLVGMATGVNEDGSLEVEVAGQPQRISAADVVHLRPAGSE